MLYMHGYRYTNELSYMQTACWHEIIIAVSVISIKAMDFFQVSAFRDRTGVQINVRWLYKVAFKFAVAYIASITAMMNYSFHFRTVIARCITFVISFTDHWSVIICCVNRFHQKTNVLSKKQTPNVNLILSQFSRMELIFLWV